jgi:DNA-binding NarL/FixJ family response regulator
MTAIKQKFAEAAVKRPRVVLADDHQMLREAFARLLEPTCDIVGTASDGRALLSVAAELHPDIIVLDISMPSLNGLDAARHLQRTMPEVKVIFLTVNEDPDLAAQAMQEGASGYLLKNSAASELQRAIDDAMQGRTYITPLIAKGLVDILIHEGHGGHKAENASLRQREVLQLLAEGKTMKQIASILGIKPRTVAFHKYGLMKQVGAKTTADLIKFAVKLGVTSG